MTKSELRYHVKETGSHFFDCKSMKFLGDTMRNYGLRESVINTHIENNIKVWELYRIHAVKNGVQSSAYFDKETFGRRHAKA